VNSRSLLLQEVISPSIDSTDATSDEKRELLFSHPAGPRRRSPWRTSVYESRNLCLHHPDSLEHVPKAGEREGTSSISSDTAHVLTEESGDKHTPPTNAPKYFYRWRAAIFSPIPAVDTLGDNREDRPGFITPGTTPVEHAGANGSAQALRRGLRGRGSLSNSDSHAHDKEESPPPALEPSNITVLRNSL
jgi:hypothetical protein